MAKSKQLQIIKDPLPIRIIRAVYPVFEKIAPVIAHRLAYNLFFTPVKFKTPERELPMLNSARRFEHIISKKNVQFYCWGNEKDPLVVLVHGWMGRATQFYKLVEELVATNHHVVAFDGPAHGASSGRKTDMNEFAECIEHISNKFGPIHCAIGHSFGGITILNAIRRGTEIKQVGMIATPSIGDDIISQFELRIKASPATGESFRKEILKRYNIDFDRVSAGEMIKSISIDCLMIVHDKNDQEVPIHHAELMVERYPDAITIFTSGLGHTRILRNDEVIEKVTQIISSKTGVGYN